MKVTVSILAEIPEELHDTLTGYLENHPAWDQDSDVCGSTIVVPNAKR